KGLSISRAVIHALRRPFQRDGARQKGVETSLIERFLYPKFGPGQMWEEVAARVQQDGGEVHLRQRVVDVQRQGDRIASVTVQDLEDGSTRNVACDFMLSTIPVRDLVAQLKPENSQISDVAGALPY